jgi:hypothetical protein
MQSNSRSRIEPTNSAATNSSRRIRVNPPEPSAQLAESCTGTDATIGKFGDGICICTTGDDA